MIKVVILREQGRVWLETALSPAELTHSTCGLTDPAGRPVLAKCKRLKVQNE